MVSTSRDKEVKQLGEVRAALAHSNLFNKGQRQKIEEEFLNSFSKIRVSQDEFTACRLFIVNLEKKLSALSL